MGKGSTRLLLANSPEKLMNAPVCPLTLIKTYPKFSKEGQLPSVKERLVAEIFILLLLDIFKNFDF